jgi:hypothetical protein
LTLPVLHHLKNILPQMAVMMLNVVVVLSTTASTVRADDGDANAIVDFENELQPIFTRLGCNSGPCHGKARGQGGFQLSLLGFDAQQDFDAITKEGRGRRIFPGAPEQQSADCETCWHGSSRWRSTTGSRWSRISNDGQLGSTGNASQCSGCREVDFDCGCPCFNRGRSESVAGIVVTAKYSDGTERDVTRLTAFQSNEAPVAAVDENGQVTAGQITGDAAIMARFMGQIAVCEVLIPRTETSGCRDLRSVAEKQLHR